MGYRIALTFNMKRPLGQGMPLDFFSEYDSKATIDAIFYALKKLGSEVHLVEADTNLFEWFKYNKVDIVFNIAEGIGTGSRESQVPAILEMLGIPYVGSNVLTLALALDKAMAKRILASEGIPTPRFQLFSTGREELDEMRFPLIVKPNREGSGKGITSSSVVYEKNSLYEQIQNAIITYRQDVLVEEFIKGRELTVGILGNNPPKVLPILEIDFSGCKRSGEWFYSWRMKEHQGDKDKFLDPIFICPAQLDVNTEEMIKDIALRTHKAIGCMDLSRTDIILSNDNIPYVLEINPLPGLDPLESNIPLMARCAGLSYEDLIDHMLKSAIDRYGGILKPKVTLKTQKEPIGGLIGTGRVLAAD